jgi:hypothetical protein
MPNGEGTSTTTHLNNLKEGLEGLQEMRIQVVRRQERAMDRILKHKGNDERRGTSASDSPCDMQTCDTV